MGEVKTFPVFIMQNVVFVDWMNMMMMITNDLPCACVGVVDK